MRKLSTLLLLALLAAPVLAASSGPADTRIAPETDVIWIAVGNTPMAVQAMPEMVTMCYFGNTVTVPEKIARRLKRSGARCGACGMEGGEGTETLSRAAADGVCDDGPIIWVPLLAPKAANAEKVIQLGGASK